MQEKMLEQFEFPDDLKEKIIGLVLYQNQPVKEVVKKYELSPAETIYVGF